MNEYNEISKVNESENIYPGILNRSNAIIVLQTLNEVSHFDLLRCSLIITIYIQSKQVAGF